MHAPTTTRTLRAMVIDLIETTTLADPRDIAARILKEATETELHAFLGDALATEVRLILGEHRKTPDGKHAPAGNSGRSAKVAGIREAWRRTLTGRYSVAGTWKVLADFTEDDALTVATERRQTAADAIVWAERFETLAKAIADAGATTAGDLPAAPDGWPL